MALLDQPFLRAQKNGGATSASSEHRAQKNVILSACLDTSAYLVDCVCVFPLCVSVSVLCVSGGVPAYVQDACRTRICVSTGMCVCVYVCVSVFFRVRAYLSI